jgi:hypothetical protein
VWTSSSAWKHPANSTAPKLNRPARLRNKATCHKPKQQNHPQPRRFGRAHAAPASSRAADRDTDPCLAAPAESGDTLGLLLQSTISLLKSTIRVWKSASAQRGASAIAESEAFCALQASALTRAGLSPNLGQASLAPTFVPPLLAIPREWPQRLTGYHLASTNVAARSCVRLAQ